MNIDASASQTGLSSLRDEAVASPSSPKASIPSALVAAHPRADRKRSFTIWVTDEEADRTDFFAHKCGFYRAQFLRQCINAGINQVLEKHYYGEGAADRLLVEYAEASAIEARRAATAETGAVHESAVGDSRDAQGQEP